MDATALAIFIVSAFFGGITTGLAGFAMGLVVSGVWLYVLTPFQTASLIVAYGLFVQAHGVWKLRHAIVWRKVVPLIAGGAFGVPVGVYILGYVTPSQIRLGVGLLLIVYSLYGLLRPIPQALRFGTIGGAAADMAVGFFNGILGGSTGLAGPLVVMWSQWGGATRHQQRAIFQPVILSAFLMSAAMYVGGGHVDGLTMKLFAIGVVPVLAGIWVGLRLYGKLDEAAFRRLVLVLLLLSGLFLAVPVLLSL